MGYVNPLEGIPYMDPTWKKALGDFSPLLSGISQERTVTDAGTEAYLAPEATLFCVKV